MRELHAPAQIDPVTRPHEFDDVLGTCGELGLMLGRLKRARLLSDAEYAACRRQLMTMHDQLATQQRRWQLRSLNVHRAS